MSAAAARVLHDAYPVRTVARLTGLSPDLIRAWEKRYGVVTPQRGPRGSRLYSADDISHLRALAKVVGTGRAIGDVAELSREQLETLAASAQPLELPHATTRPAPSGPEAAPVIERVLEALLRFDAEAVERQLSDALVALGAGPFARQIAAPLLDAVGDRWSSGSLSVGHEHLVSGVLRNLLTSLIRARHRVGQPTVLLATPSGDRHEFGLLLVALMLLDAGVGVAYLGVDLPAPDVVHAARSMGVAVVGLGVVDGENRSTATDEVRRIEAELPQRTEIWLGGREADAVAAALPGSRVRVVAKLDQLETEAARLRTVTPF